MLLEFSLGPIWVWLFVGEVPAQWTLVGGHPGDRVGRNPRVCRDSTLEPNVVA